MCGIAGIVATDGLEPGDRHRVLRMCDVLAHRGPDDRGLMTDETAALGHRRLSIVDLAGGAQPMPNETRTIWVVFNGEIYNHADLREYLLHAGHVYRSRSDTETIVHAYEQWGPECVDHLRGMFAFAVWDAPRRRLLLARDRLGVKPLYWTRRGTRLLFGSEIKALLASGLVTAHANEPALPELLATRALADEETLFRGVWKLQPGHVLSFGSGRVSVHRYWDVPAGPPAQTFSAEGDDRRRFRALLEESIRLRLMSDVPLGVFLSGGLDSSAIAALAAPMVTRPLDTFSVAFADRAFSELEYSRVMARAIGAVSHEVVIDDRDFFGALPRLIWHEDEPIAHASSVPLYFVSKLAAEHVKVVLTGEGSDELLAGYSRYRRALLNWKLGAAYERLLPPAWRSRLARVWSHLPGTAGRYARRSFLVVDHVPDLALFDSFAAVDLARQRGLLADRLAALVTSRRAYRGLVSAFEAPARETSLLDRLLYSDLKTYLVELLMKQDQMSMAASIESRVPFLDHHLVEFAAGLPPDRKLSRTTTKRILREAVKDVVPAAILERRKMGFPVPFAAWMRGRWNGVARDVLLDGRSRQRGVLSPPAVERLLDDARTGVHGTADAVWSLLNLELWYRTFIDGEGIQTLPERGSPATGASSRVGATIRPELSGASHG
jgi:asparagine synthase (glutamine-hydrolysing)